MIAFDGNGGDVGNVNVNPNITVSLSTVNNYYSTTEEYYTTVESYITNNYTTVSENYTTISNITNNYTTYEGTMPYMKIWDFPDGPYQYNIMGGISNPLVPFNSYLDILGAYNISALDLTGEYSKINLQGINMKSI